MQNTPLPHDNFSLRANSGLVQCSKNLSLAHLVASQLLVELRHFRHLADVECVRSQFVQRHQGFSFITSFISSMPITAEKVVLHVYEPRQRLFCYNTQMMLVSAINSRRLLGLLVFMLASLLGLFLLPP